MSQEKSERKEVKGEEVDEGKAEEEEEELVVSSRKHSSEEDFYAMSGILFFQQELVQYSWKRSWKRWWEGWMGWRRRSQKKRMLRKRMNPYFFFDVKNSMYSDLKIYCS